jgi:hypothetical protein
VEQEQASAGLGFGGYTTTSKPTEEFNSTIFSPATGAWASGGNMNTARHSIAGAGTQTAGLAFGGRTGVTSSTKFQEQQKNIMVSLGRQQVEI